jgi:hypothetical protein
MDSASSAGNMRTTSYCGDFSDYIPDEDLTIPKYIRINFHIMQKTDGTGNFQETDTDHMTFLNSIVPDMNDRLENIQAPLYGGATGDPYIQDSKLRFVLKEIYFHQDDAGWENNYTNQPSGHPVCNSYCFDNFKVNDDSELNIFFVEGIPPASSDDGGGCGPYNYVVFDGWYNVYINNPPGTYGPSHLGGIPWIKNPGLIHEIGHCLTLNHTFSSNYGDTYYPQSSSWCHPATDYQCTNNIMSYSATKNFLSPNQLRQVHKELIFNSDKEKWVANCEETITQPITVTTYQDWDYAISIADELTVSNSSTVDVSCSFDIVENSLITVDQYSTLNFNSATINFCDNCSEFTMNIYGNLNYDDTPFNLPENAVLNIKSTGVVTIDNDDGICINPGAEINIENGGQLFINSINYTSLIPIYNNNYDLELSTSAVTGNKYAFNTVYTTGSVSSSGTTTVKAGREITFNTGFIGNTGLYASIDELINNCEETLCSSGGSSRLSNPFLNDNKATNTSFNNSSRRKILNIAPNPNNGYFNISIENDENNKFIIEVYDMMGKKVLTKNNVINSIRIDMSDEPKGIYFVKVLTNGANVVIEKIIKQ